MADIRRASRSLTGGAAEGPSRALGEAFAKIAASGLAFEGPAMSPPGARIPLSSRRLLAERPLGGRAAQKRDSSDRTATSSQLDARRALGAPPRLPGPATSARARPEARRARLRAQARSAEPVLLLDDVSSELDAGRTGAVYDFVRDSACQIFVTTTRPELFLPGSSASERAAIFTLSCRTPHPYRG